MRRTALLFLSMLLLSACGDDAPTAAECQEPGISQETAEACIDVARSAASKALASASSAPTSTADSEVPALTGPATEPATFPGGLTAQIVSVEVEAADPNVYDSDPTQDTLVTVTVSMTPWNDEVYPLDDFGVLEDLMYGVNRYTAQGWMTEGGKGDLPQQVTPGTTVTTRSQHTLPADGLSELSFEFSPSSQHEEPWTFTGVEDLLPS